MRHRRRGRKLGRNPNHQRALLRNLASSLILTERDAELDNNKPKVKGRVVTTISKAKEVRPLVEKCITIARRSLDAQREADQYAIDAERNSDRWREWRSGEGWRQWNASIAPVLAARRRAMRLLGDKEAVKILFEEIAPRFEDRPGGYTRILRLAKPRLGDSGQRAVLEFVGVHDRVLQHSERPAFEPEEDEMEAPAEDLEETAAEGADSDDTDTQEADSGETAQADADETSDSEDDATSEKREA